MVSPSSSRRIHLGGIAKCFIATLTDARKLDFQEALVRLGSGPEPDGASKIALNGFPYQPGINAIGAGRLR